MGAGDQDMPTGFDRRSAFACAAVGAAKLAQNHRNGQIEQIDQVHASGLIACNRILMSRPNVR